MEKEQRSGEFITAIVDYRDKIISLLSGRSEAVNSYLVLRRFVGFLGMSLPIVLIMNCLIFNKDFKSSISAFYYTNMQDFFTAVLCTIAFFLLCYRGRTLLDNVISTILGILGVGIAAFPCAAAPEGIVTAGILDLPLECSGKLHNICAVTFFILLAINSLFIFTLSKDKPARQKPKKRLKNAIFIVCGLVIAATLLLLGICMLIDKNLNLTLVKSNNLVFIGETAMLFAFGISWLTKGDLTEKLIIIPAGRKPPLPFR